MTNWYSCMWKFIGFINDLYLFDSLRFTLMSSHPKSTPLTPLTYEMLTVKYPRQWSCRDTHPDWTTVCKLEKYPSVGGCFSVHIVHIKETDSHSTETDKSLTSRILYIYYLEWMRNIIYLEAVHLSVPLYKFLLLSNSFHLHVSSSVPTLLTVATAFFLSCFLPSLFSPTSAYFVKVTLYHNLTWIEQHQQENCIFIPFPRDTAVCVYFFLQSPMCNRLRPGGSATTVMASATRANSTGNLLDWKCRITLSSRLLAHSFARQLMCIVLGTASGLPGFCSFFLFSYSRFGLYQIANVFDETFGVRSMRNG